MPDTNTVNLNLVLPEDGGSTDTWGGPKLNVNFTDLDAIFNVTGTQVNLNINRANVVAPVGVRQTLTSAQINLHSARVFMTTVSGNITFTVTNVSPAGTVVCFLLELTNGGAHTVTWWSGIIDPGGVDPTLTASGKDVLGFLTHDGGTTWWRFSALDLS